ncbi:hypothetical protein DCCM_0202 [Desulfocucumis palustris]|uniref:Uncharacterized protein n=1 Tax=Desulfocucumis palustris TaxID=1898651 RepID=A0A2L2XDV9_9FIRM|nr:hypothetical protein DCCM_0202 [Desulfocucumis palustris]
MYLFDLRSFLLTKKITPLTGNLFLYFYYTKQTGPVIHPAFSAGTGPLRPGDPRCFPCGYLYRTFRTSL